MASGKEKTSQFDYSGFYFRINPLNATMINPIRQIIAIPQPMVWRSFFSILYMENGGFGVGDGVGVMVAEGCGVIGV